MVRTTSLTVGELLDDLSGDYENLQYYLSDDMTEDTALTEGMTIELSSTLVREVTTYEKVETIPLIVIKKDNCREQYDRSKIEAGVLRACHKRPVSVEQITRLVDEVETEIFNREEKEIPSTVIGEILMDKIKDLDAVAYVRFASVYREFKDVNTFMNELKKMLDK